MLLLGRPVDWLGEAKLSRLGLVLLAAGVLGMPLSQTVDAGSGGSFDSARHSLNVPMCDGALSRVINPRERGFYMGMHQTYDGVSRIVAPLFFGWCFDRLGVRSPYFFSSAIILARIWIGYVHSTSAGDHAGGDRRKARVGLSIPVSATSPVESCGCSKTM